MTESPDNCGYPEGILHAHMHVCWAAGFRAGQVDRRQPTEAAAPAEPVDPVQVFADLVREVDAGRVLIAMTPLGDRHRAAADALALARDVLADARDLLGSCACGAVFLVGDAGDEPAAGELVHAAVACVAIDEHGDQL